VVRLADLTQWEQDLALKKNREFTGFLQGRPWVKPPPLKKLRVALITSAGLHRLGDRPFTDGAGASEYRVIEGDVNGSELVMSHLSSNFDRSGFAQDVNVVFPIDRLKELAADGVIGEVAGFHYAFNGSAPIKTLEAPARKVAAMLKADRVDAVFLTPV
jgi:D-proline reductase (dithiol) PrdB